jgi:hypothetical protein
VDAVLRNKNTGEVMILEVKTSSGQVVANGYKNSSQAIGYSVVLDVLFPKLSGYKVLYLVYKTKDREYEPISYPKSYLQRAQWIQEQILQTQIIGLYEQTGVFPMHGESCVKWFRDCKYLGVCTLSTEKITAPLDAAALTKLEADDSKYDFHMDLNDLIQAQLDKTYTIVEEKSNGSNYIPSSRDEIL